MTFVFSPAAIENILFNKVLESLKMKQNIMSCGFSTTIPGSISISVLTLGELEKEEIEKVKLLLNTVIANENEKREWSQFSVHENEVADFLMNYEFMSTGGQSNMHYSLLYFLK